jgi:hypothetical protein
MRRRRLPIAFLAGCLLIAGCEDSNSFRTVAAVPDRSAVSVPAAHRPTPFPLPKRTPDWTVVETPTRWDYRSTGPDRSACARDEGLAYQVGPSEAYLNPRDVPWLRLLPCDTVLIHYRAKPYDDIVYIASRGRRHKAITIAGVPDPATGARPVLDGSHAVTPTNAGVNPYVLCFGMIVIANPSDAAVPTRAWGYKPGYLIVENLEVRNAYGKYPGAAGPVYTCTDLGGKAKPWGNFTAGLYVNPAEHLLVKNMYFHNNGLGAFANSLFAQAGQSRDFYVTGNVFSDNGNTSPSLHNYYAEVIGERVIHNHFGPPVDLTQGENIKDRSVCAEYADNYIDGGNSAIAFRDPQSNGAFEMKEKDAYGDACVGNLFVHGNTFVSRGPTVFGNMTQIVGFGDGATGGPQNAGNNRYGHVYFYGNVVVAIGDSNAYGMRAVPIFQNGNVAAPTTFSAIDNLFYTTRRTAGQRPPPFAACYWQGLVGFVSNWSNRRIAVKFATKTDGSYAVGKPCDGSGMRGIVTSSGDPGFVDAPAGDYHTKANSPFAHLKAPLPAAVTERGLLPDGQPYP